MIYFSEIVNKKVFTEDQVYVGKLADLIFIATEQPRITKLHIKDKDGNKIVVPIEFLVKFNHSLIIRKNYEATELADNELFILRNLLDKQIIDIKGNKVVRVNDVVIQDKPYLYVSGVDIDLLGVLRWFGFEKITSSLLRNLRVQWSPKILSWADIQPLELARGRVKLRTEEAKLEKVRPEDLADHLEKTNITNVRKILNLLDKEFAAEVIGNLNVNYQTALFRHFSPEKAASILEKVSPDEAVDILLTINKQKREQILSLLSVEQKKKIMYLLNLSKTPIGDLITSEYITADSNLTVKQIIDLIRKETTDFFQLNYVYLINSQKQLVGVCNLHELLLQDLNTPAYRFMTQNLIVIHLTTPEEIAVQKMLKYKLYGLPVIDNQKCILGIVTFDDIMEYILDKLQYRI